MKTTQKFKTNFLVPFLVLLFAACSSDSDEMNQEPDPNETFGTISEVVASGDSFENFPPNTTTTEVEDSEEMRNQKYDRKDGVNGETIEQRWVCTERVVDVTGGTQTFPLYNPNASVIWPGNLLQGKTLDNATPSDIVVKRAAGKITYNLVTGNTQATVDVAIVDQGTVQQAMNDVIRDNGEINPANFTLDIVAINSREELALEMGLKVSTLTTKVSGNFSYNSSSDYSSVLVKLTQAYYTMSYVKPTSLDEVFDPSVTPEQLATFIQPDNPATFISSVTYGRIFYMLYESTASAEDMKAALSASYNAVAGESSGSVNIESLREYNNLSVKVIAYGGDSEGTLNTVGAVFGGDENTDEAVDNLQDIVGRLAASSDIRGGLPLSYVVNSLEDPSQVVSTNLATRYTIKNCELKGILPDGFYSDLVDLFDDGIGAMGWVSGSDVLLVNKAGNKYAWYNGNLPGVLSDGDRKIFDLNDPTGPLGGYGLNDIGALTHFQTNQLYIFNKDGFQFQILNIDPSKVSGNSLPTEPIGTYAANGNIFSVNADLGDSAGLLFSNGFEAGVNLGNPFMAYFEKDANSYQVYNRTGNGSWSKEYQSTGWYIGQAHDGPDLFEKVGAATRFTIGGSNTRYLFVNAEGDELMEWFSNDPANDVFEGPWVIN